MIYRYLSMYTSVRLWSATPTSHGESVAIPFLQRSPNILWHPKNLWLCLKIGYLQIGSYYW